MEKLENLKIEAQDKITELEHTTGMIDTPVDWTTYEKYLFQLRRFVETDAPPEIRSRVIEKLVSKVIVYNDRVSLQFRVCDEFYQNELISLSSQTATSNKMSSGLKNVQNSDFLISGCSNSLTVGADEQLDLNSAPYKRL
jgi:hypothetical protein